MSKANSLDKIISVLNNGFSISQAFMFCIGKLEKDKINEILNYLYEIYHITKDSIKSILSDEIKLFQSAFENLFRSLKNSDVDLSKFKDLPKLSKKSSEAILNIEKPTQFHIHSQMEYIVEEQQELIDTKIKEKKIRK